MHILRQYVDRIEGMTGFASEAAKNPAIQGIVLDLNPFWVIAYRMTRAGLRPDAFFGTPWMPWRTWRRLTPGTTGFLQLLDELYIFDSFEGDAIDLNWRDKTRFVQSATRAARDNPRPIPDSALPFIVKVVVKPVGEAGKPDVKDLRDWRARLVTLASAQPFFAVVETRPLGMLALAPALAPGDACVAGGEPGTIGGFLKDGKTIYAVTCGHVAQKGTLVYVSGSLVGTCSESHRPVPLEAGESCTAGCTSANRLDLALIDVGQHFSVANTVTKVAVRISPKQAIVMRNKTGA